MRHCFVDERAIIALALLSPCHWKTLVRFCLWKKRHENAFLNQLWIVVKSYRKATYAFQNNSKLLINDIWCYLVICCFDLKISFSRNSYGCHSKRTSFSEREKGFEQILTKKWHEGEGIEPNKHVLYVIFVLNQFRVFPF